MSRVEQALRRAGNTARLVSVEDQQFERSIERTSDDALDLYQAERPSVVDPVASLEREERSLRDERRVREEHPVSVATSPSSGVLVHLGEAYASKLVTHPAADPSSVEQYRRLAAAVHHLQGQHGLRTLMVTSSVAKEGKTLTVVNLAMTLSESYKRRVLLVDADLRRPSIHTVFGIPNKAGLCDALRSETGQLQCAHVSPLLWAMPAGSAEGDPMSTLASDRMATFLEEAAGAFDWVLLDAPPVGLMADAGLLARLTKAVVLVIGAGSTPYKVVDKVVNDLGREHIVGTVLNRAPEDATEWSDYYAGYAGIAGYPKLA